MAEPIAKKTPQYAYLILDDVRSENYAGWSIQEVEVYGREGYIEEAVRGIAQKEGVIATHAVGASKCNLKKLKEVQFVQDEQRSSILYAQVIAEFANDVCLFRIDDYLFKNKQGCKSRSNESAEDLEAAISLFSSTNLSKDVGIVGLYSPNVKKLFRKNITDCQVEYEKGMVALLYAKKLEIE